MRLRHIRDGKELKPIFSDEHYDFSFQEYREIYPAVQVLPGDRLLTECVYSTLGSTLRENVTFVSFSYINVINLLVEHINIS